MNNDQPADENDAWERRFQQLGQLKPESPKPFFYTRLRARLESPEAPVQLPRWLRQPAYVLGAFSLIILLNVGALLYYADSSSTATADVNSYEGFITDYQLTTTSEYNNE